MRPIKTECLRARVTLTNNSPPLGGRTAEKLIDRRIAEPSTGETDRKLRDLTEAMRAGRDARIRNRMMAVRGVPGGYPASDAACLADAGQRTVRLWVERSGAGGAGGLRDIPGRGRNPRVRYGPMGRLAGRPCRMGVPAPGRPRDGTRRKPGRAHGPRGARGITGEPGFSPKGPTTGYAAAADDDAVRRRRAGAAGAVARARRRKMMMVVQDGPVIAGTGTNGRRLWSRVGEGVAAGRSGRGDGAVARGSLAADGTGPVRPCGRSGGDAFLACPGEIRRERERALVTAGSAGQHGTAGAGERPRDRREIGVPCLPAATPKPGAAGAVREGAEHGPVAPGHHGTPDDLRRSVSGHFRTCPIRAGTCKFPYRSI